MKHVAERGFAQKSRRIEEAPQLSYIRFMGGIFGGCWLVEEHQQRRKAWQRGSGWLRPSEAMSFEHLRLHKHKFIGRRVDFKRIRISVIYIAKMKDVDESYPTSDSSATDVDEDCD